MPLPNFTVTGSLFRILGEVSASELVTATLGTTVLFTPNVPLESFVTWDDKLYKMNTVAAKILADGSLARGPINEPVRLLANDAGLSIDNLQWKVDIYLDNSLVLSVWFDAPEDGDTVSLADIVPVPEVETHDVG